MPDIKALIVRGKTDDPEEIEKLVAAAGVMPPAEGMGGVLGAMERMHEARKKRQGIKTGPKKPTTRLADME